MNSGAGPLIGPSKPMNQASGMSGKLYSQDLNAGDLTPALISCVKNQRLSSLLKRSGSVLE